MFCNLAFLTSSPNALTYAYNMHISIPLHFCLVSNYFHSFPDACVYDNFLIFSRFLLQGREIREDILNLSSRPIGLALVERTSTEAYTN